MLPVERITTRWLLVWGLALGSVTSFAHAPVARCFLLDEATVRCRGASNDGDEMLGSRMQVIALDGAPLLEGKLSTNSTWTFKKPTQPFYVLFDISPGLQVTVEQEEIKVPPRGRTPRWMRTP